MWFTRPLQTRDTKGIQGNKAHARSPALPLNYPAECPHEYPCNLPLSPAFTVSRTKTNTSRSGQISPWKMFVVVKEDVVKERLFTLEAVRFLSRLKSWATSQDAACGTKGLRLRSNSWSCGGVPPVPPPHTVKEREEFSKSSISFAQTECEY